MCEQEKNAPTVLEGCRSNANAELRRMKESEDASDDERNLSAIPILFRIKKAKRGYDQGRCKGRVVSRCREVEGKIK